ncbi:FAD-binding protein [Pseudomonas sp. C2L12B]|uniref:FAD-binding protein n=2 Tax=Pseudomonas typographi TaxID=2715964 RepID=A0ABR7YYW9_9PSED|nr:FAD-dependent oxidoreductase [Pseudomonas typographi]MBD1554734.1 FAD-binding protein [Pseudomonas typographi]MBD1589102.1 FAD-binding protein [Pseudomonas typographi]MBD1598377.1 FAD-binding protein [Pseudomonas typographi]
MLECDVLVVGSGSAALAAALTAAAGGLKVRVLEKTQWLGGTSAMSGGATWVPGNHHARAAGLADSAGEALAYLRASAPPGWQQSEDLLWQRFSAEAGPMLASLEAHSPLRFALTTEPDPLLHLPGAKAGGRMLAPRSLRTRGLGLGALAKRLRPSPLPQCYSYQEIIGLDVYHHPFAAALRLAPQLIWRSLTGTRSKGAALILGLLAGCKRHGCAFEVGARVSELTQDAEGRVSGAWAEQGGRWLRVHARRGVILASGGFEWDAERLARHFPGPLDFIASPRSNEGDGQRMAEAVGAQLAHMDQANINPAMPWRYEGRAHSLAVFFHYEPNAIIVNRHGRRFVNEFTFNIGEALDERERPGDGPLQLPAWVISDVRLLHRAPLLWGFWRLDRGWLAQADTLEALAAQIGLPADELVATVARFNGFCAQGVDQDFGRAAARGAHAAQDKRIHAGLEAIEGHRYIAISFNRSFLATKGGPRTDAGGHVLRSDGSRIEGLYCAGVAMANPIGTRAVGAGTTLGPNMTWGYICAQEILAGA